MTGEEIVHALLGRIALKRARIGELTMTLSSLEQLLRESLVPLARKPELGYPKKMTKLKPSETPWVPTGPGVPQTTWVNNREEEEQASRDGFSASPIGA